MVGNIVSPLWKTVNLRVLNRNFRDFSLFNVDFKRSNCPFARYASVSSGIGGDIDILNITFILVSNDWLVFDTSIISS
jgi:hypothetical protein